MPEQVQTFIFLHLSFIFFFQIPGLPMSSQGVSKSTTLRGPKFDDEIDVKRDSTATPVKTWKTVPSITVKKLSFKDKTLKSMKSFTLETANRFNVIREESCPSFNIQHTKPTEVNAINKPFQSNLKEKKKIKT